MVRTSVAWSSREADGALAIKCNPDPYVLRLLAGLGTGFDCASMGEISRVTQLGVDPSRIIFANPCKAASFIRNSAKAGVDMMTFDNTDELFKIARVHPAAKLVLRILTDDSKSLCRLGLKFGAPLVTVPALLEKARELKLDVIGVSFHVGSGCYDSSAFADAVKRARATFDMGKEAGYEFTLLDVGGGFEDDTFEATASILKDAINEHFPDRQHIRIIAEPGRYFVSKAFSLAANVIARRAPPAVEEGRDVEVDPEQPCVMCTCAFCTRALRLLTKCELQTTSMMASTGHLIALCSTTRLRSRSCYPLTARSTSRHLCRSGRAACGVRRATRLTVCAP